MARGQGLIDLILSPSPSSYTEERLSIPEATFEEFWAIYNGSYGLFGVKHIDWAAVHTV